MIRSRPLVVLAAGASAGLVLLAASRPWARGTVAGLAGPRQVSVDGGSAAPAAVALALAAAAACVVLATTGRRARLAVAVVLAACGLAVASAAVGVVRDPAGDLRPAVEAATGVRDAAVRQAGATAWAWAGLAGGLGVAAAGGAAAALRGGWAQPSRRFELDPGSVERPDAPEAPRGRGEPEPPDVWDALSRGEDPTDAADLPQ